MRALLIALILLVTSVYPVAAREGSRVDYMGGTRPDIPNDKPGEIRLTDNTYFVFLTRKTEVKIPYERINLVEYGQQIDRRYAAAALISPAFALMKKREHFLTLGFQDDEGRQQAMLFRINKDDVRLTLIAIEARTGQKVAYQDEEARIAGK
jgi:hypothetical protein